MHTACCRLLSSCNCTTRRVGAKIELYPSPLQSPQLHHGEGLQSHYMYDSPSSWWPPMRATVLRLLQAKGPLYRYDVVEKLGLEAEHATKLLRRLRNLGLVESPKRGLWKVVGDVRPHPKKRAAIMAYNPNHEGGPQVDVSLDTSGVITVLLTDEDRSPKVDCPARKDVTAASCIESYVSETAQKRSKSPCHKCDVGKLRRKNYARS